MFHTIIKIFTPKYCKIVTANWIYDKTPYVQLLILPTLWKFYTIPDGVDCDILQVCAHDSSYPPSPPIRAKEGKMHWESPLGFPYPPGISHPPEIFIPPGISQGGLGFPRGIFVLNFRSQTLWAQLWNSASSNIFTTKLCIRTLL